MDHNKLWKILKEMGIPDHLTLLLRNRYAGQGVTVRIGHGTTDWFQIGKGVHQGCILSPCLFNLCAEYIMRNAVLDEAEAGIKIARRNINNVRYADAIQPSHPLLSPSPPPFNLSQHQGLFQGVSSLHQVAKVLEFQLQHQSFQ